MCSLVFGCTNGTPFCKVTKAQVVLLVTLIFMKNLWLIHKISIKPDKCEDVCQIKFQFSTRNELVPYAMMCHSRACQ